MSIEQRALFETAVVDRLKESGFLEIEIRTECLVRCDDGYQDEVINAGWHYWNAAVAAQPPAPKEAPTEAFIDVAPAEAFEPALRIPAVDQRNGKITTSDRTEPSVNCRNFSDDAPLRDAKDQKE